MVSIHAPARGATVPKSACHSPQWFQSTLPRGERRNRKTGQRDKVKFQSTLPRGERPSMSALKYRLEVSIHAPARGATTDSDQFYGLDMFNPRSRAGSDPKAQACWPQARVSIHAPARGATRCKRSAVISSMFQSTLPRGERRQVDGHAVCVYQFQSTLPRGERPQLMDEAADEEVSIHAPARGATHAQSPDGAVLDVSIHAPARGAT